MMDAETREALEIFIEETRSRVAAMDEALGALRSARGKAAAEVVHRIFRDAHSLKGAANLLGLSNIELLAHHFEEVLDRFRKGTLHPDEENIATLRDTLRFLLRLVDNVGIIRLIDVSRQVARLSELSLG